MHCQWRVQKLQMGDLGAMQPCCASGKIRHFQKEVIAIGSEQGNHTVNLFTSDRPLALAPILLLSFPLLCLWCVFFSYPHVFIGDPADQFPSRCSPNSSGLPLLWITITLWAAGCCGNLMLFSAPPTPSPSLPTPSPGLDMLALSWGLGITCFSQNPIA